VSPGKSGESPVLALQTVVRRETRAHEKRVMTRVVEGAPRKDADGSHRAVAAARAPSATRGVHAAAAPRTVDMSASARERVAKAAAEIEDDIENSTRKKLRIKLERRPC
jgi:hypothetical protein